MARNAPLLVALGIPWQDQQNESVKKIWLPQSASGQEMKLSVNVSWIHMIKKILNEELQEIKKKTK